jgi:hypothetical protein
LGIRERKKSVVGKKEIEGNENLKKMKNNEKCRE